MRIFLVTFVLFAMAMIANAQSAQQVYGTSDKEEVFPTIRLSNGDYLFAGSTTHAGFGGKDVMVTRTDAAGNLIWSRQYGGAGDEFAITLSETPGGFLVGGETFSNAPNGDAFILKIDGAGTMLWWKNYGGGLYDITYSVLGLNDGSVIAAGLMETAPSDYDSFLMKTDANGDTLWTKVIGIPGIEHAVNVIQTSDSGFIFCGKALGIGQGVCECLIVKTDANGDTLWTKIIGGQGWDESMDILETPTGYVVCGGTNSQGNSNYDFFLMQLDFSGNLTWVKQYGGLDVEASYCVQEVPNEGYIIAGYTETYSYSNSRGTDSANAWIVKTDYMGDTLWSMVHGGNSQEECFSVAVVPNVGYAFTGYTKSFGDSLQAYLFMTDSAGYTGCTERRTHPVVFSPSFVAGNHSFNVSSGFPVNTPAISQANTGASRTVYCGSPLSVEEKTDDAVFVFPNPTCEQFTIKATSPIYSVNVYSLSGKWIYGGTSFPQYSSVEWTFPAPEISGVYIVDIVLENGAVMTRELVTWR